MLPTDPGQPRNLTADAELAGLTKGHGITQVLTRSHLAVTIRGTDGLEAIAEGTEADIVYVIISGYGVLRCRDGARIEFTAGDVMMVPAGAWHQFEEVSPKFRTWRIMVGKPAEGGAAESERALPLT
ncbi:cupin domain-containing protein [Microvirga makkahensis]|uniref:Cupin domain-containing protein n=1 Tax=Microvirga makkahensis TaxID=1128670 RepID=A0A7X3MSG5_9HYPH|nr:cupin domain-containing protein [Microvirga makkahensis]MXQ12402.1 cupin domain-containing protein [Microvirga makkahensis]